MLVGDFPKNSAQLFPNKTAIIFGKKKLTYEEMDVSVNRLANALISYGIKRDDRVGVFRDRYIRHSESQRHFCGSQPYHQAPKIDLYTE